MISHFQCSPRCPPENCLLPCVQAIAREQSNTSKAINGSRDWSEDRSRWITVPIFGLACLSWGFPGRKKDAFTASPGKDKTRFQNFVPGTKICILCPSTPPPEGKGGTVCPSTVSAVESGLIFRKFRLSRGCHGKLALLAARGAGETCECTQGLSFHMIR